MGKLANQANNQAMIVRTPVLTADDQVAGIDIRLVSGPQPSTVRSALTIDYQTLFNEGIQGSLIIAGKAVLFANDNAAHVLGFATAQSMIDTGQTQQIFNPGELERISEFSLDSRTDVRGDLGERVALGATSRDGKPVRLIARITQVQWGAASAILLSFVDVALAESSVPAMNNFKSRSHEYDSRQGNPTKATLATVSPLTAATATTVAPGTSDAANAARVKLKSVATPAKPSVDDASAHDSDVVLRNLRLNLQRYRHYTSAAADFFWEIDEKLMFRVVSDQLINILGVPREYLVGRTTCLLYTSPSPRDS